MARSHYHAPYPSHRAATRWPWVVGLLLLGVFAAAAVIVVRDDLADLRSPSANDRADTTADGAGAAPVDDRGVPGDVAVAGAEPDGSDPIPPEPGAAAVAQGDGSESDELPNVTVPTTTATETVPDAPMTPAPTADAVLPTAEPTVEPPQAVVETFVERWSAGDFAGLHELLGQAAQETYPRDEFVERYRAIAERAGLTTVRASVDGAPNLQSEVPIRVEMESSIVGSFVELNRVPLLREGGAWRIAWTPSLIFRDLGADGCVDVASEIPPRGRILDRNNTVLAEDGPILQIVVVPGEIEDETRVLQELSRLTDLPEEEIKATYEDKDPGQYWVIEQVPQERERELLNALSDLPGAGYRTASGRVYPLAAAAAHVVGYIDEVTAEQIEADASLVPGQLVGQAGIEAGAEDLLTGEPGGNLVVVQCETRAERKVIAARPPIVAKDLVLTIDAELQQEVDAALTAQGKGRGSAVVLDPRTGETLAMVSHPSFNPNGFVLGFSEQEARALSNEKEKPLLNRAAQAAYPTGSIFKAITMSAAMEHLGLTGESPIDCPSTFSLEGSNQTWEDWTVASGLGPQGLLTLHQGLVNSCNTIFYQLGRDLDRTGEELLPNMAKAFGLGAPTEIPYLPEVGGTVPDPKWKLDTFNDYWARGDAVNLAIGQGFLEATPLQMATAYAAIANGGDLLRPFVVSGAIDVNGKTEQLGERMVRSELPLSRATLTEVQSALRDQTSDPSGFGSVRVFGDFAWPIAGKTGTAQNQINKAEKPHSWFAAFGPYGETSTIASVTMVESIGEGISYAAPVTRQFYEAYLRSDLADGS